MPEKVLQNIPEHAAPVKLSSESSLEDEQSPQEMRDVKMVLDLLENGRAAKADIVQDWDTRWDFYNGEQWDKKRPRNKSNAVLNIIKVTIQSLLPILTDSRPGFDTLPEAPDDFAFAKIVSKLTQSWWEKKDINHTLIEVLMDAMIYDAGIFKITWDPDENFGIGDVKVDVVDPREIYLPKEARDFNRNCSWVIQLMNKPVGELKRKFPEKAHLITADSRGTEKDKDQEKTESIRKVTLVSPTDREPTVKNRVPEGSTDLRDTATVAEAWMDDDALIEYAEENKDTGEVEQKIKKKYPFGKVITVLVNKKIILAEVQNPYRHRKKPYVRFIDTILPRRFWGDGEVKGLMSIQRLLNKTLSNIIDYMNFTSNPVWLVEEGSGADYKRITNSYGLIIKLSAGGIGKIKRDIPPPLPQYMLTLYNLLREGSEIISGIGDISQGRKPTGVTAAAAIETIQEAAHTRIRLKERNMQVSLAQMGRMVTALMMQFYTQPRVARITGGGAKDWPEFFEFHVTPDEANDTVRFNKTDFTFNEQTQEYDRGELKQGKPSKGVFDIKVLAGTSLPFAKAQRSNVALRLHDSGAIDQEDLLEKLEWPDKDQVLERMAQAARTAANEGGV